MNSGNQTNSYYFFLVTPTHLEDVVLEELRAWLPDARAEVVKGGIELETDLAHGLELNRVLKTPTRILLRLADFGCRDFPKLFRKISGFPWEEWLDQSAAVEFSVSTHTSRLRMKKRIEETCKDGYRARLKKQRATAGATSQTLAKAGSTEPVSIFVRFVDDVCTLSLDTSGEILHKRGLRPMTADAPLRETLAATLLLLLERESGGASTGIELVDPMMGGGTFLLEARDLRQTITSRAFAFESPALAPLKKRAEPGVTLKCDRPSSITSLVGYEADEKTWRAAKTNLGEDRAELHCQDFFAAGALPPGPQRWLIANPPYGERLKVQGSLADFYARLFAQAEKVASPEAALFLLPSKVSGGRLRVPAAWRKVAERNFSNGGLPVTAHIFARR
jgi:putative N6-adenine-specific DNA methylase